MLSYSSLLSYSPLSPLQTLDSPGSRTVHFSFRSPTLCTRRRWCRFGDVNGDLEPKLCSSFYQQIIFHLVLSLIGLHLFSDPQRGRQPKAGGGWRADPPNIIKLTLDVMQIHTDIVSQPLDNCCADPCRHGQAGS
jgi:hypothetical protein